VLGNCIVTTLLFSFDTLAPRTCVEAQFSFCCPFNCFLPAGNCSCDGFCYRRGDCCVDIQETCRQGVYIPRLHSRVSI